MTTNYSRRDVIAVAGLALVGTTIGTTAQAQTQTQSGAPIEELNFNGPALGVTFRW